MTDNVEVTEHSVAADQRNGQTPDIERRRELAANLAAIRHRVAEACARSDRSPDEVTLVAVTKTRPASDVVHLAELGVAEVGENRDQEAAPKAIEVAASGIAVRWHFIGQLQRNKCRSVASYADVVESVDGVRLAHTLNDAVARSGRPPIEVLVQVSIDGDPARGGAVVADPSVGVGVDPDRRLAKVLQAVHESERLTLAGLMAVAPLNWHPRTAYQRLADVVASVRRDYPQATIVSAGMSDDFAEAIDYGATHVRVGSALLGNRAGLL